MKLSVHPVSTTLLLGSCLALALSACQREPAPAQGAQPQPAAAAASLPASVEPADHADAALQDVIETNERYIIGISYPKGLDRYPGLGAVLSGYANDARGELMDAVEGFGNDVPSAPYELSLAFEIVSENSQMVVVAGNGSRYTGGAHGQPLIVRFVWLVAEQKLLPVQELIPDATGWSTISAYVAEQLQDAVAMRAEADKLEPAERAELLKDSGRMIEEGTQPSASNFEQYVPIFDARGKIVALRFVFPPYQVGPYADGVQQVEVPAGLLYPHIAPAYLELFAH
ncbi:DUF3298 and DUF4163 domain-containing protein [Pseudoxanthomonas dokdonensis]|uniref:DUF3298 domain-containing protein n=1 Tax=Pseudoxanthomonas dokdonensis TaxID=344882 RepID=A0A0R0CHC9_9GAMM|nr:DUF3298 and DUF4163 domain-containing protein [Pseudoxanthomonas dokdonensis]KRG68779.1 hypothetical protein ABB29_09775 [Pseudoxanthomonas dokdonensis]